MTHPNVICQESSACFAAAIAVAIATGGEGEAILEAALAEAKADDVRQTLERARSEPPLDFQTHQGWVLIALQNAFYRLLHEEFEQGIVATVHCGGDTDTTAAIAGALLGAKWGRRVIPTRWQSCVRACRMVATAPTKHPRGREFWPIDVLELAERLLLAGSESSE